LLIDAVGYGVVFGASIMCSVATAAVLLAIVRDPRRRPASFV
jgi:hypothetical protein